jgi:hypothetical protein
MKQNAIKQVFPNKFLLKNIRKGLTNINFRSDKLIYLLHNVIARKPNLNCLPKSGELLLT